MHQHQHQLRFNISISWRQPSIGNSYSLRNSSSIPEIVAVSWCWWWSEAEADVEAKLMLMVKRSWCWCWSEAYADTLVPGTPVSGYTSTGACSRKGQFLGVCSKKAFPLEFINLYWLIRNFSSRAWIFRDENSRLGKNSFQNIEIFAFPVEGFPIRIENVVNSDKSIGILGIPTRVPHLYKIDRLEEFGM